MFLLIEQQELSDSVKYCVTRKSSVLYCPLLCTILYFTFGYCKGGVFCNQEEYCVQCLAAQYYSSHVRVQPTTLRIKLQGRPTSWLLLYFWDKNIVIYAGAMP